jgi:uncharacterized membrane protein YkvA (DUF1232 family)
MTDKKPKIPKSLIGNPKAQLVFLVLAVVYILSPVDFIPDVWPVIGWVDDISVFLAEMVSIILYLKQKRKAYEEKSEQNNPGEK